jgi:8-oxo-dGTP diphosphatase
MENQKPCPHCGKYNNRGVSVDAVIINDGKILLVRRGDDPFKGYWALPGGYVEWDESIEETVKREAEEETGLHVKTLKLIGVYGSPKRHPKQVINVAYLINGYNGELSHGDDAKDAKWFALDMLPPDLAFDHYEIIQDAMKQL